MRRILQQHCTRSTLPRRTVRSTLARRTALSSSSSSGSSSDSSSNGGPTTDDVKVDRSGLGTVGYAPAKPQKNAPPAPPPTPLGKELESQIRARGPVSVHEYVKQCLLHPTHGYYARKGAVHNFGAGGDFVTAPELSQLFGELIGVWFVSEWQRLGKPAQIRMVEVGPGRGTLCADILRATATWPPFREALTDVHLVEPSLTLRVEQRRTLNAQPSATSTAKPADPAEVTWVVEGHNGRDARVSWHSSLEDVPTGTPTLFIGQEVLDAFPPYQFVKTDEGWREKLVDLSDDGGFRFVLAPQPTPASRALVVEGTISDENTVEVAPGALALSRAIAERIAQDRGAALLVDYGFDGISPGDTLRGFRRHKQVHPLEEPGLVDLTVDADFGACATHAAGVEGASVYGSTTQGEWLQRMGIVARLEALLALEDITERQVDQLIGACEQLVDPAQMGARYRVLSVVDGGGEEEGAPAGFAAGDRVAGPPV